MLLQLKGRLWGFAPHLRIMSPAFYLRDVYPLTSVQSASFGRFPWLSVRALGCTPQPFRSA